MNKKQEEKMEYPRDRRRRISRNLHRGFQWLWFLSKYLLIVAIIMLAVDFCTRVERLTGAKVVDHDLGKAQTIDVIDNCMKARGGPCRYARGKSESMYRMTVRVQQGQYKTITVPESYYYAVQTNEHIPIVQVRGTITGIVYATKGRFNP